MQRLPFPRRTKQPREVALDCLSSRDVKLDSIDVEDERLQLAAARCVQENVFDVQVVMSRTGSRERGHECGRRVQCGDARACVGAHHRNRQILALGNFSCGHVGPLESSDCWIRDIRDNAWRWDIQRTQTLTAFRAYSKKDLEQAWDIGVE